MWNIGRGLAGAKLEFSTHKFNKSFDALVLVAILFAGWRKCNFQDMAFPFSASLMLPLHLRQEFSSRGKLHKSGACRSPRAEQSKTVSWPNSDAELCFS